MEEWDWGEERKTRRSISKYILFLTNIDTYRMNEWDGWLRCDWETDRRNR